MVWGFVAVPVAKGGTRVALGDAQTDHLSVLRWYYVRINLRAPPCLLYLRITHVVPSFITPHTLKPEQIGSRLISGVLHSRTKQLTLFVVILFLSVPKIGMSMYYGKLHGKLDDAGGVFPLSLEVKRTGKGKVRSDRW